LEAVLASSIDNLRSDLIAMGSTDERAFEESIAKMITQNSPSIIEGLYHILENESNVDIRFRAFFGITLHHRRQNNHTEFKNIVDQNIEEFRNIKLHDHVLALLYKSFNDRDGILKSLDYSKKAIEKLNRHVGVLHNFCETIVIALEENLEVDPIDLENAASLIETVITLSPNYAKFYCTKGRILAQNKKFDEAKKNIMYAIDIENSKSNDYSIRISEYRNFLVQIKTNKLYESVKTDIEEAKTTILTAHDSVQHIVASTKENMESMKAQNLQMLAFFTAIISFTIGSINILNNQRSFMQSAMLILILAGAMVITNTLFSILLTTIKQNIWKYILVVIVGFLLIGIGIVTNLLT
jgi:tetratricopeptide (TPR) repeat protein